MPRKEDFSPDTKDLLAKRVGMRCSNPNCRQPTSGPREDAKKVLNIGVGAHLTAASKGGPRYDSAMSSAERRAPDNGIWLCQNCAKLIDNDDVRYTVDLLQNWKRMSEEAARLAIEAPMAESSNALSDAEIIRFFAQCFDRPAFQDYFHQEGSMEAFDKAVEDTITAINTGTLRARDGGILQKSKGKAYLRNAKWRQQMDVIADMLRAIRSRYDSGRKLKLISVDKRSDGTEFYCISDRSFAEWMDRTREEILRIFSAIAHEAGIHGLSFPRSGRHW